MSIYQDRSRGAVVRSGEALGLYIGTRNDIDIVAWAKPDEKITYGDDRRTVVSSSLMSRYADGCMAFDAWRSMRRRRGRSDTSPEYHIRQIRKVTQAVITKAKELKA